MTYRDPLLDRLAAFEPKTLPVLSLYLNTSSGRHGRDDYAPFLRKELGYRLYVADRPHLYPLARLNDQFRPYAALIADTNAARLEARTLPATGAVGMFGRGLPRRRLEPRT
jgi:hypothetical protein